MVTLPDCLQRSSSILTSDAKVHSTLQQQTPHVVDQPISGYFNVVVL